MDIRQNGQQRKIACERAAVTAIFKNDRLSDLAANAAGVP